MYANSRPIHSAQTEPHPALETVVRKHLVQPFQRPISAYQRDIFANVNEWVNDHQQPVILDSGCGVGESTRKLAEQFPAHLVIGVDKSEHRLRKNKETHINFRLVRANIIDFWRLIAESDWRIDQHFLLYPNPYPKSIHLKRRWHGHPIFPTLIRLCPVLELRSNWRIYLEEWDLAYQLAIGQAGQIREFVPDYPFTPFERKYHASGHTLYQWRINYV